ncbi:alpha 1,2 mannosyltransferase [Blastocladiella emersonii ATCC 22665]|nr:alpha 1,2 mannosyltransferase [Blastocladiella emersonii ATCC 22665]
MNDPMLGLAAVRLAAAIAPSYIHPDEFFQTPEVAAHQFLGVTTPLPWEFDPAAPARSIFPVWITAGLPFLAARALGLDSGRSLFVVVRLVFALQTLLIDYLIATYLVPRHHRALSLTLASWAHTGALMTHSFSNTTETLALTAALVLATRGRTRALTAAALGAVLATGVFVRATFVLYAWPVGLVAVVGFLRSRRIGLLAAFTAAGVLTAAALVACDSLHYGALVFPILTNLRYNADAANLAHHGLHPRITHLLVNVPLLFGPMLAMAPSPKLQTPIARLAAACAASGLALLSLAPHQEARFLFPLYPCVLAVALAGPPTPRSRWWTWGAAANAVLYVVFAGHQAGIVPAAAEIASLSGDANVTVVSSRTYAVPGFLLSRGGGRPFTGTVVNAGSDDALAAAAVRESIKTQETWLIAPRVPAGLETEDVHEEAAFWHASFDDWPGTWRARGQVRVYRVVRRG